MIRKELKYNLHNDDVQGDFLRLDFVIIFRNVIINKFTYSW